MDNGLLDPAVLDQMRMFQQQQQQVDQQRSAEQALARQRMGTSVPRAPQAFQGPPVAPVYSPLDSMGVALSGPLPPPPDPAPPPAPDVAGMLPPGASVDPYSAPQQLSRVQPPARPQGPRLARVTNTTTSTSGRADGDRLREDTDALAEKQRGAAIDRAKLEVMRAEERASQLRSDALAKQKAAADVSKINADGQVEADAHLARAAELRNQASDLEKQGHNFWDDKSAWSRMSAIFGSALVTLGQRGKGGPNEVMDRLDAMMAREDKAHRDRIDGLRSDAKSEVSFYDLARTRTKDRAEQQLLARDMMLGSAQEKLGSMQSDISGEEASVAMAETMAAIEQKRIATQAQLSDMITTNQATKVIPLGPQGGGVKLGPDGEPLKEIPGTVVTDGDAYAGLSAEERKIARKLSGAANALHNTLAEMAAIRRESGSESGGTEAAARYANLSQSAKVSLSQMMDQGTITAADAEQMKDLWEEDLSPRGSDAQRVFGVDPTLNKITGAMKNVEGQANNRLRAYGLVLEGLDSPNTRIKGAQGGFE